MQPRAELEERIEQLEEENALLDAIVEKQLVVVGNAVSTNDTVQIGDKVYVAAETLPVGAVAELRDGKVYGLHKDEVSPQ